eukprot:2583629-Pyramimonas_sp.AAC.1
MANLMAEQPGHAPESREGLDAHQSEVHEIWHEGMDGGSGPIGTVIATSLDVGWDLRIATTSLSQLTNGIW